MKQISVYWLAFKCWASGMEWEEAVAYAQHIVIDSWKH